MNRAKQPSFVVTPLHTLFMSLSLFLTPSRSLLLLTIPRNYLLPLSIQHFCCLANHFSCSTAISFNVRCHSPLQICLASLTVHITTPFVLTNIILDPLLVLSRLPTITRVYPKVSGLSL